MLARLRLALAALVALLPLALPLSALAQTPLGSRGAAHDAREDDDDEKPRDAPIARWNAIAIDASGLDHTPPAPGETRGFGEQLGPTRASRAMAIVHIALFEALNAIAPRYQSLIGLEPAHPRGVSARAAVAQAAHDALAALYPAQRQVFRRELETDLARVRSPQQRRRGIELGARAAAAILEARARDGSQHAEPRIGIEFFPGSAPGDWRPDPITQHPLALGALWGGVRPFSMSTAQLLQLRAPPPPALSSKAYARAFDELQRLGGDGEITPTERSDEQGFIGVFWAYDGTPSLCAPPRLYNQITTAIAAQRGTDGLELARLLALINVALADATIAVWESKYFYELWRPVTGIREAEGDGNPATLGDPEFTPLGAPASNLTAPNFTPPFPSYPSGHAGLGGALFETLRGFYGTDRIAFRFVSDEFNGVTRDRDGSVRPLRPRQFRTLSEAEEENGQSRIYLGIHWAFDKTTGIEQGRRVARRVLERVFGPLRKHP